jgi:hypothetical protein
MPNYLHYEFDLNADDVVEIIFDHRANAILLDDANFALYREGKKFHYFGGHVKESPAHIPAPRPGHWHAVIDLGGYPGTVRATARLLQGA